TRYCRLMRGMAIVSLLAVVGALGYLRWAMGDALTIHMIIATAAGVGLSVMLGAALLGLVVLSSGSWHDGAIEHPFKGHPGLKPLLTASIICPSARTRYCVSSRRRPTSTAMAISSAAGC